MRPVSGTPADWHAAAELRGVKIEPGVTTSRMDPAGKSQPASAAGAKLKSRAQPDSPESTDENESGAANSSQPINRQRARTALVKMEVAEQATPAGTPGATLPYLGHALPLLPGGSCVCCRGQQRSGTCNQVPAGSQTSPAPLYLASGWWGPFMGPVDECKDNKLTGLFRWQTVLPRTCLPCLLSHAGTVQLGLQQKWTAGEQTSFTW